MKKIVYIFIAAALFCPIAINGRGSASRSDGPSPIGVDGGRFVDGMGREVILRGVNAGGRSKLPPFLPFDPEPDFDTALEAYADSVASLGFNVVRLLIIYEAAEPVRGEYDQRYLEKYDAMVRAFGRRGVHVIVDAHQDLFSRRFCGDGFPDWALAEKHRGRERHADCGYWSLRYFTRPVASSFDRLYQNVDGVQDSYVEFFGMLAERYRGEPAVIGFEPINEPMPGARGMVNYISFNRDLFAMYERVADAVHAADPRYLIFAEPCALDNQNPLNALRKKPDIDNLVLAPHYYDLGTFGISASPGGDQWMMRRGLKGNRRLGDHWDAPVLLTEYGISPLNENAVEYIGELYEVFDELLLSGTFWEASMSHTIWNNENTSLFEPDGEVRPASLALDRPYPMAVAGTIESFSFQPESGSFELIWEEDPLIAAPTEVRLPARIYSDEPSVELDPPGRFSIDPDSELLVIPVEGEALRRRATVSPPI